MSGSRVGISLAALALLIAVAAQAQQVPDRNYRAPIAQARFAPDKGPAVCVDEAHANFHTLGERFWAFGELLREDGFVVRPNSHTFDRGTLESCAVLVISNALPGHEASNKNEQPTPTFSVAEIAAVHEWVQGGGALLLIADHMPFGGASANLAAAFDVEFTNGFAMRDPDADEPDIFSVSDLSLRDHAITRGRNARESVKQVRTFTGQAFRAKHAEPLLVFPAGYESLAPLVAWEFPPGTPRVAIGGWLQGAVQTVGKGRAAFFGEAAMFSAQLAGPDKEPAGMNAPGAEQNFQLVLNVVHWLTRTL